MPIKLDIALLPAVAQVAAGDSTLIVRGSNSYLVPASLVGSSAPLFCQDDGNYYNQTVVLVDGIPTLLLEQI